MSITDHETLSASVQMLNELKSMKENGEIYSEFKLSIGNEIYLVNSLEEVKDNYQSGVTKFPHFILLAKNRKGFEALSKLSSQAWKNSFYTGAMERVPTEKEYLREVVSDPEYNGSLMASSACLGAPQNIHLMKMMEDPQQKDSHFQRAVEEVKWAVETFGKDNYFIELQPADTEEQKHVNKYLVRIADELKLECIVACDTHYARPEDREIHKAFLNSKEGDREVDEFYYYAFMHSLEEMHKQMAYYLGEEVVQEAVENTNRLYDMTEEYTLDHSPIIPKIKIPEFKIQHMFAKAYDKYEYIKELAGSENEDNQYMLHLIEEGFMKELYTPELTQEYFHKILDRINKELREILGISKKLNDTMSSYYLSCREIVNIIWDDSACGGDSIVGSGRGSGAGFLLNYLLGITQINPLEYVNMPHERHASEMRPELADLDIDIEGGKRSKVISALKHYFGQDQVLQVATYGSEGSKSAIKTAARGLGIEDTEAQYIASMIPSERGSQWPISDCLYGNLDKDRKPNTQFKNEMEKYPLLTETALKLEGIIARRGIHAGGVIIFNDEIHKHNAMMTAAKGEAHVTQFNLNDSEQMGGVKYDLLSVENLDRIRATLDLLEEEGQIDYKNGLRQTFTDLLHPKNLNLEDETYFKMASENKVNDIFQFNTEIGNSTLKKIKPHTFEEFCAANSLMRLQSDGGEQPIDMFIRYKNNMDLWYKDMKEFGLNQEEIEIMREHLEVHKGVNATQEISMALSADERISGFNILEQNKLRKTIAKPKGAALGEVKNLFYSKGKSLGTRKVLLDYVWKVQFYMQMSYSFSQLHVTAYSIIGIQNLELNRRFDPIYWQTACLNVDSGSLDDTSVDYAKMGSAIGKMQKQGVNVGLPSINKSKLAFTADRDSNTIKYGLGAIKNINGSIATQLIKSRPYTSLEDFLERAYNDKIITNTHLISLVKSGALDEFGERKQVMMDTVRHITPLKESYTLASVSKLLESGVLSERPELPLIELRESFKGNVLKKITSPNAKTPHKIFKVGSMEEYTNIMGDIAVVGVSNDYYKVDEKEFKKEFDKRTKDLKEWLKSKEAVDKVNRYELNQQWIKYALGTYASWEMESLSYYFHDHELAHISRERYGISDFDELPEEAEIERYNKWGGREIPIFKTTSIAGVVIGKNDVRHTITLLTDSGVVTTKYHAGAYSHYAKQLKADGKVIEKSWFSRGNKLIIHGFRRGSQFVAKTYKHSITEHTTRLIEDITDDGALYYKLERERI